MPTIFLFTGLIIIIVIVIVAVIVIVIVAVTVVAVEDLDMGVCELSWRVGTSAVLGR